MLCFRCGVCCSAFQPCLSLEEAGKLAGWLGLDISAFREKYSDPRWPGTRNLLVRQEKGDCVFLERLEDGRATRCRIHQQRPSACRDWVAGPDKPQCVQGLQMWGLAFKADKLVGPENALKEFEGFLKSLAESSGESS
jgi:hypothetical protein